MNLSQIADDLKAHFESAVHAGETFLAEHLPALADMASKAASNPLVDAALSVVHVSPEMLTAMADVLRKVDADLGTAKAAQAAAEQAAAAVQPAAAAPDVHPVPGA